MKLLLWTAAFLFGVSAIPVDEWDQYKAEYNKVYTTEEENMRRLQQYLKSKEIVEEHNRKYERGETSFQMGINKFSDWFPEEIDRMFTTKRKEEELKGKEFHLPPGTVVPDSVNWVEKGAVTKVKDQGKCNSAYAFSAVGAMEGMLFIANNTITDLSVQELLDCAFTDGDPCTGGYLSDAYNYLLIHGQIDTDESYPYEAKRSKCRADKGKTGAECNVLYYGFIEEHLKHLVLLFGPTSVSFSAGSEFIRYKSGVYDANCNKTNKHQLLVVGCDKDEETGKDYWLVKNSWGTKWGEDGYVRIRKGVNKCHIGNTPVCPLYNYYP